MAKVEHQDTEDQDGGDAPLIDLNDASVKKLIARAKKRGTITIDELNEALPQDQMSSEQIEDIMSALNDMGVQIVEKEEGGDDDEEEAEAETASDDEVDPLDDGGPRPAAAVKKETVDRTDDPVRMYLREMGAVELLSREGEIAIAKRIEAGRDTMIWGCAKARSPSTPSSNGRRPSTKAECSCARSSISKRCCPRARVPSSSTPPRMMRMARAKSPPPPLVPSSRKRKSLRGRSRRRRG
jgi:hypothetical protein